MGRVTRMARKIRVEYEGEIYHLMNRGGRREPIFKGDPDRTLFLETRAETCAKTSIDRCGEEGALAKKNSGRDCSTE